MALKDALSHINLMRKLTEYRNDWRNYIRMTEDAYMKLLNIVGPVIQKKDTHFRKSISPNERLSATLRFLVTGMSYEELKFPTAISEPSLSHIIPETCAAIIRKLRKDYLKMPATENDWKQIADNFERKWQFPHCLGAIDGKHIAIRPPPGGGSYYYNYKKFHSVVLMACGNADYEFTWCEVGCNGRISDGGVMRQTHFYEKLNNRELNIPDSSEVKGIRLPYVFVGDEAFALREDFMKPFAQCSLTPEQRILNYRLSRARRIIENIFGIICNRFRILQTTINLPVEKIDLIVLTICVLHNFLRKECLDEYQIPEEEEEDNEFANILTALQTRQLSRNPTVNAKTVRENFKRYFNTVGAVDWQDQYM